MPGIVENSCGTPPELLADIMSKGIYLSGGGSLLRGLDLVIQEEIKMPTRLVEDPITAVALGTGKVLSEIKYLKRVTVTPRLER